MDEMMMMILVVAVVAVEGKHIQDTTAKSLYFVQTPTSMTSLRGEEVVLECEAAPGRAVASCQWSREGAGLGGLQHLARHSMRGCSLVIYPVLPEDEGEYRCQVAGAPGLLPLLSPPAHLQELTEPGLPAVLEAREADWVEVVPGQELLLTCQSQGARPHAQLSWRDGQGEVVFGHAREHVTRIGETGAFKTVSTLRFNPLKEMVVSCSARSAAFPEERRSRELRVLPQREVEEEEVEVGTGQHTQLSCGEEGGAYIWTLDGGVVEGETGPSLVVEDFRPEHDKTVVRCLMAKVGGETRLLKQVRLRHKGVAGKPGKEVKGARQEEGMQYDQPATSPPTRAKKNVFTCVSEGGEQPEYVWVEGRLERREVGALDSQGGKYRCRRVRGGGRKVRQVEKKLAVMAKDLARFSRILRHFTGPLEDSQ